MTRKLLALTFAATALAAPTAFAHLDHPVPSASGPAPGLSSQFNSGGENAEWELLNTLPTANPHSDLDFFTQGADTYAAVGVLGIAANGGGQSIFRMTRGDQIAPELVSNHPSASCVSDPNAALGLQHDVEATPKGNAILNTTVPNARRTDAQLLLDATDAPGRCHDQGTLGVSGAPRGGLEIIDITDIENPKEIGLTSHIGQAHTVNVDPRRPHIAYAVTSDTVGVDAEGRRANESGAGRALDGFEVVDLRSCLEAPLGTIPPGSTIERKRELCRPEVYRYRYPSTDIVLGHTNRGAINGCHELEIYPDDRITCGSGSAMIVFDVSQAFDDGGTPADFTDDKPRGAALPCAVRDSSTAAQPFRTGAKVTDCVTGREGVDLGVGNWMKIGAPSLEGVAHVGSAFHMGRSSATGAVQPAYPSTEDIDFDHEAEFSHSRRIVLATDERGGGVAAGAQCSPGADVPFGNGGVHAYAVERLQKSTPRGEDPQGRAATAFGAYARNSSGGKAIFRAPINTEPKGSFCTAHVFQQIPGQNRIFMGWYSQGTQVVDFTENPDGTVDFKQAGFFIPENANQWVSAIFKVQRNADGTFTYFGATGDGVVGDAGRNGVDVYKVTLPAPPAPLGGADAGAAAGGEGGGAKPRSAAGTTRCASTAGFTRADARPRGRGVAFSFERRSARPVTIDVFRAAKGRRITRNQRVARFSGRTGSFTWNGRDHRGRRLAKGVYFARYRISTASGTDVRRFTLFVGKGGRFRAAPTFHRPGSCSLVRLAKLASPAFGGRNRRALGIAVGLSQAARVTVTVERRGEVVRRFAPRTIQAGRVARLRLRARGTRRGRHTVTIVAERGRRRATVQLASQRL